MAVFGILTVCTGNICRSPLAELILRDKLVDLRSVEVFSAGVAARDDVEVPAEIAAIAQTLGLDAGNHRSTYLETPMIELSDLILAMARDHRRRIVTDVPRMLNRTFTLREFARLSEGLTQDDIVAGARGSTETDRLRSVVSMVAARRGTVTAAPNLDDDDVLDPYRQSEEIYRRSAEELVPAAHEVARVLGLAARAHSVSA